MAERLRVATQRRALRLQDIGGGWRGVRERAKERGSERGERDERGERGERDAGAIEGARRVGGNWGKWQSERAKG